MAEYLMECPLVGESYANPDGSSRQAEIAQCQRGERVALRWDRENKHDPAAVAVHSRRGVQIGYISRNDNREILWAYKEGHLVSAEISAIYGGSSSKPMRGVTVDVTVLDDDDPAVESEDLSSATWLDRQGFWLILPEGL